MASLVRRLAGSTSFVRTHLFPKPKPYPITHHNNPGRPETENTAETKTELLSHLGTVRADKGEFSFPFFPSFPFGFCFDPIEGSGSGGTLWADSVKKKRKRKMNKHKLRKLRKSLRRKT